MAIDAQNLITLPPPLFSIFVEGLGSQGNSKYRDEIQSVPARRKHSFCLKEVFALHRNLFMNDLGFSLVRCGNVTYQYFNTCA